MIVDVTNEGGESLLPQLCVEDQVNFRLKAEQNESVQLGHAVAFLGSPNLIALLDRADRGDEKGIGCALRSAITSAAEFIDSTFAMSRCDACECGGEDEDDDDGLD